MLNYNSPIKENKNYSDLTIEEIYPVMKLNIRGKKKEFFSNVEKTLNMILPTEANTSTTSDKLTSIWLGPDEWMIFSHDIIKKGDNNYELENLLFSNISKNKNPENNFQYELKENIFDPTKNSPPNSWNRRLSYRINYYCENLNKDLKRKME